MKIAIFAFFIFSLNVFDQSNANGIFGGTALKPAGTRVTGLGGSCGPQCGCHSNPVIKPPQPCGRNCACNPVPKPSQPCSGCKTAPCGQPCKKCGQQVECTGKDWPAGGIVGGITGALLSG